MEKEKKKCLLPENQLVQEIGNITGFGNGIQLGELRDLFIRLISKYGGVVNKKGGQYL